jgi:hypothetical protein
MVDRKVVAEHSFYVSDDEKSIAIQDLLEDLKDRKVTTDFLLSLMHDLTLMMVEAENEEELELPPIQPGEVQSLNLLSPPPPSSPDYVPWTFQIPR